MTYISLDPARLQELITDLNEYAYKTRKNHDTVQNVNFFKKFPTDLTDFQNKGSSAIASLEEKTKELQARLDSAKAANESGITSMGANGTISYFIPDGEEDTMKNVLEHNHVETVKQAREDARKLKEYSISKKGPSDERWNSLVKRMKAHQDDSVYANAIINNTDPKELRNIPILPPEAFTSPNPGGTGKITFLYEGLSDKQRDESADVLGHLVSTASNTWPESKAKKYAKQLTENMDRRGMLGLNKIFSSSRSDDIDGDGKKEKVGLKYNDSMLAAVATKLENLPANIARNSNDGRYPIICHETNINGIVHAMTGNPGATL